MLSKVYSWNFHPSYHLGTGTKAESRTVFVLGLCRVESLGDSTTENKQGKQIWTMIHDQISCNSNLMLG